jgi:glycosyltransferase involved in cell wall biosynthesis
MKDGKMGIHMVTNAIWCQTGYGTQAKLVLPKMKELGYDISITAYYGLQGHTLQINDMTVCPVGYHPYGMDVAAGNTKQNQADVCMTNVDLWVCEPNSLKDVIWVPWFPIDSGTISSLIKARFPTNFARICMSKHGQKLVQEAGFDCEYIPCSVDTKVYRPGDRKAALDEVNKHIPEKIPEGSYIVSMVAMNKGNPSRKAFCQQMAAFKRLYDKHPEAVLYMHTIKSEMGEQGGVNLIEYCRFIGLTPGKNVFFPDALTVINGYPDIFLNAVYNASDVYLSVTMGEGFGIPIVEAQAAGCPVIIGDWTAMSELFASGWKVKKTEAQEVWTMLGAIQYDPNVDAIYDRLEKAYEMRGNQEYRDRATKGAQKYDIENVTEKFWKPVLEKINARVVDRPEFTDVQ